jgi:hypothetical protein
MKKLPLFSIAILGFTGSLQAGEPVAYKQVAPASPELYGTGFYERSISAPISFKTGAAPQLLPTSSTVSPPTLSRSTLVMTAVFSEASNLVTFLAREYFARRLKEISSTTALKATPISNCVKCSIRVPEFLDA